jgi:signal transduction histidine kinase
MRSSHDVQSMADKILSYLVERVGAQVGSFYLHDEHGQNFHLTASCGLSQKTRVEREQLNSDDGYISRALRERTVLIANDIPHQYLNIESTLVVAEPGYIAVIPLIHGDNLVGLIEVAGFQQISPLQHELLDSAKDSIAIGFEVGLAHQKTQMLLLETEQQAEELRVQQEELQQSNEELEERAEMLAMQREQIQTKNSEIEEASAEIMRKADDLERVSTYKSEFLANMSHELRTPLNSMLILSGLLRENKAKNLTNKQVEYATTIHSAGLDLLNLINDILDLSKVEAGQVEFQYEDEVPAMLCDGMRRLFQLPIEQKGLKFSTEVTADVPAHVHIDVQRTLQILKNLIGNALKFTREGSIGLRLYLPQAKDNPLDAPALAYAVRDTGIGVPAQKQALVFEAFKQADGGISRKFGGTGLGLSISLQLARKMGGDLKMISEEGVGTTMTLYLPLTASSAGPFQVVQTSPATTPTEVISKLDTRSVIDRDGTANQSTVSAETRKILIVEDDQAFAKILRSCCEIKTLE